MAKPAIEFVDDWSRLKAAVEFMHEEWYDEDIETHCDVRNSTQARHAVDAVVELVPKLLDAYADLWQTSTEMLNAWEAFMNNETPAGLLVPEMRVEA